MCLQNSSSGCNSPSGWKSSSRNASSEFVFSGSSLIRRPWGTRLRNLSSEFVFGICLRNLSSSAGGKVIPAHRPFIHRPFIHLSIYVFTYVQFMYMLRTGTGVDLYLKHTYNLYVKSLVSTYLCLPVSPQQQLPKPISFPRIMPCLLTHALCLAVNE